MIIKRLLLFGCALTWCASTAPCRAEVVFTARPLIAGATERVPILVELRWENTGPEAAFLTLGEDQLGGIVLIGSNGAAHRNETLPRGGLMLPPSQAINPGKTCTKWVILDEWGSPGPGHHTFAFRLSKHPNLIAKLELDVKAYKPEAAKAVLVQLLREAEKKRAWEMETPCYLEAVGMFSRSSEAARQLVAEVCKAPEFEKMPAKIEKAISQREMRLRAID
jgi:hypothetical protein